MATFARFINLFALWGLIACSLVAGLGALGLVGPKEAAIVLLPGLLFGQISSILIGNWGAMARIRELGFLASMTREGRPGFSTLWSLFRSQAKARSLWRLIQAGWVVLGLSLAWTMIPFNYSSIESQGRAIPFLSAFVSIFFLAHAVMTLEALFYRGLIGKEDEPSRAITPE